MTSGSDPTKRSDAATARARRLRVEETEPEYRLWSDLRSRRLNGYKFVRQIPVGRYIADFVCRKERLIVEIDGSQHADSVADTRRTIWLNEQGYSVLRFWNEEVLKERRAVLETILAVLEGRINAPSPGLRFAPATLSPAGRGDRPSLDDSADLAKNSMPMTPAPSSPRRGEGGRSEAQAG